MVRGLNNLLIIIMVCHIGKVDTAILSRNKAIQSNSTFADWIPSRAIDGSTNTDADACHCCSATLNSLNPWYELDLGKRYKIQQIDVVGRIHWRSYGEHFQGMQITFTQISVEGFTDIPETTITKEVGEVKFVFPVPKYTKYISLVLRGVYRVFTICELTVYGDCDEGEFGDYCENRCHCDGDPCDKVTGICPTGKCLSGYYGENCDTEESPSWMGDCSVPTVLAIAGGTAGTVLIIEAVAYLIWKRRQGHADRRSSKEVYQFERPGRKGFTPELPFELKQRRSTINR